MNEKYITGTGQVIYNVHSKPECLDTWCVVHNPAPGPWASWPTHWLQGMNTVGGRHGIMTRVCPHGFLHPCAEDVATFGEGHEPDHGCDGCPCGPEHIGALEGRGVARAKAILGVASENEPAPRDYSGRPAKQAGELTLREKFLADHDEASAEDVLSALVHHLVGHVIANNGDHPGRAQVSAAWLEQMEQIDAGQAKTLLQFACWHLAEGFLVSMERAGALAQMYGVRLGKGFREDDQE